MLNKEKRKVCPFLLLFPPPKKRNQDEGFFNKHFSGNLMNMFEWLSLFPVPFLLNWSDKGLIWECFYLKELFLSDTSFGPAWVQDFLLLMQFTPSAPFLILLISKNVRIHLPLEVSFFMASNLNRYLHSHIPCRIHCSYCICTIIHTGRITM